MNWKKHLQNQLFPMAVLKKDVDKFNTVGHFWQYFKEELRTKTLKKTHKCKHVLLKENWSYILVT